MIEFNDKGKCQMNNIILSQKTHFYIHLWVWTQNGRKWLKAFDKRDYSRDILETYQRTK
jgi:hypothetical protein